MTEHEPLCPWNGTSITFDGSPIGCQCALIRKVHTQMSEDGWVAPETHEAVVETRKVRARMSALTRVFDEVNALPADYVRFDGVKIHFVDRAKVLALIEKEGIYTRD